MTKPDPLTTVETVPPPKGASDAYSAKTRVGTLPEHVLEAMRDRETDAAIERRTKSGMRAAAAALAPAPLPVIEEIDAADLVDVVDPPPLPPVLAVVDAVVVPPRRSWFVSFAIIAFFAVLGGLVATVITVSGR